MKTNLPDNELARLAAAGDATAFCEIHDRHRLRIYSIALRMTGNAADAEDLTQESFLRLFLRIGSFRGEASLTTWLHRLVVNEVKMHFPRSDVRMALRYTHATAESKRRAVENLAKPIGPSDESVTNEKGRVAALP
jgi:RNA polymerase sigma-70 factor, ECF subfamily